MKKLSILISVLVVLSSFSLNVKAQDIITLKSGQTLEVQVISETNDSVKFYFLGDPSKDIRCYPNGMIESIERHFSAADVDSTFKSQVASFVFTDVIKVDASFTKDQLYQKVKQWFSETFVSSKNVIDNADKDEGVIYGHATIVFNNSTYGYVNYNIEIRCKDGKVKYLINDFMHKDACCVNVYGYCPNMSSQYIYSIGSLSQKELPDYLTYNKTGRSASGREKMWKAIREKSLFTTYNLIQSLKQSLTKEAIQAKDSW